MKILVYLAETSFCLAVLFLLYRLFLGSSTDYRVRRFALLFLLVFSFAIPAVDIRMANDPVPVISKISWPSNGSELFNANSTNNQPDVANQSDSLTSSIRFDLTDLLLLLYVSGLMFFGIRFLLNIISLVRMIREASASECSTSGLCFHPSAAPAFSFFHWIILSPKLKINDVERGWVVDHETIHRIHSHSIDRVLLKVAEVVIWFNPVIYWVNRELQNVHEYFVDRKMCEKLGIDAYVQLLIGQSNITRTISFASTFASVPLTTRVRELLKNGSKQFPVMRIVAMVSFLPVLFYLISCSSEFDVMNRLPDGKRVREISVYYYDQYGDMPEYDGRIYSHVAFDRKGNVVALEKGTFSGSPNGESSNLIENLPNGIEGMAWFLDYAYYDNRSILAVGPLETLRRRVEFYNRYSRMNGDGRIEVNGDGNPMSIFLSIPDHQYESTEFYSYDENGRWTTLDYDWKSKDGKGQSRLNLIYANADNKLVALKEGDKFIQLSYTEDGVVSEVSVFYAGGLQRRVEFTYNTHGLRSECVAFNRDNQKEYVLRYEYRYF